MELEVAEVAGAGHGERSPARLLQRNGYRDWQIRAGTVELRIPKLRRGSYFPASLGPRGTAEKALMAVIQKHIRTRHLHTLGGRLGARDGHEGDQP